ncbi:hypothetical protein KDL29_04495 [bacterium]|nr:hypothetical protein [bacterium]
MSNKPQAWRIAGLVLPLLLVLSVYLLARAQRPLASPAVASEGVSQPGRIVNEVGSGAWCIHQDPDGVYWLGCTESGLFRIAGQEITNYTEADGLAGNNVRGITGDGSGGLLITTTRGLSRFDGQNFSLLEPVDYGQDWGTLKPGPKQVWLILDPARNNPCLFDGDSLISLHLPPAPGLEDYRRRNPNLGYDPAGVYTIYRDRAGNVWFGTASLGACRWDGREFSWLYEDELVNTPAGGNFGLRSIFEDRDGAFWICNTRQRFEFSAEARLEAGFSQLAYSKLPGLPDAGTDNADNFSYFASVTQDPDGTMWLACGTDGVWQYAAGKVHKYPICNGAFTMTVQRDKAGRTWVGTGEHGLHWIDGDAVVPFGPDSL